MIQKWLPKEELLTKSKETPATVVNNVKDIFSGTISTQ